MKYYQSFKKSKWEKIGKIPTHWNEIRCGHLFREISIKNNLNEMNLSVYRDYGVIPRDSRDDNYNRVSEDTSNYKLVEVGDFVLNKMKCWMGSLGVSEFRGIVSPSYTIYKTTKQFNRKYFHYLLRSNDYIQEYDKLSYGVRIGQWELHSKDFKNIISLIPPPPEQKQIVSFLDHKTQLIDELVEITEKKIELLKEKRTSLINHCVTKGLNPNVEMKDSGVEWIGEIPIRWVISKLKWFSSHITDGSHFSPVTTDEGKYYVTVSDVTKNNDINFENCKKISDESFDKLQRDGCQPNISDVLITKDGTIGRGLVAERNDYVILSSLGLIRTDYSKVNPYYLLYYLLSGICVDQMYSHIRGSGITRLTIKLINDLLGIFPPLPEQKQIVAYLDEQIQKIDTTIEKETQRIELLKEYRQSLISEVVTGKIDVRDEVVA